MTTKAETVDPVLWERVRSWFHYPNLDLPTLEDKLEGGAFFDFKTRKVKVGRDCIDEVVKATKISEVECLEGILTHEIGHYVVWPREISTLVLACKMIKDKFGDEDSDLRNFIFQTYADLVNDLDSVTSNVNKREAVLKMRIAGQETMLDEVNAQIRELMLAYLLRQAIRPFTLSDRNKHYFRRMCQSTPINQNSYFKPEDVLDLRVGVNNWGDIIKEIVGKRGGGNSGNGDGPIRWGGCGPGDFPVLNPEDILKGLTQEDREKIMKDLIDKVSKGEYKDIEKFLDDYVPLPPGVRGVGIGFGGGMDLKGLNVKPETVEYYKLLSQQYPLIVTKKPVETERLERTFEEREKWRVGGEPLLAMPEHSGGLFLPGITRKRKIKQRPVKTKDYDLPHLLIAIDSSCSMPNPETEKSNTVLAGFCAARSYHLHGSAIGVINFSGGSYFLPYTRNLDQALAAIAAFQGSGTVVDVEILKKMLGPERAKMYQDNPHLDLSHVPIEARRKEVSVSMPTFSKALEEKYIDLLMFTDGGIGNLNQVLDFFEERKELNRATIILVDHYNQEISRERKNVTVHRVKDERDIPNLVIGDIKQHMNYYASCYEEKLRRK